MSERNIGGIAIAQWACECTFVCDCGEERPNNYQACCSPGCKSHGCDACGEVEWCGDEDDEDSGDWFCSECYEPVEELHVNPNFDELMADLRVLWSDWKEKASFDKQESDEAAEPWASRCKGSWLGRVLCMEDIERLLEKYGDDEPSQIKIHQ